MAWLTRTPYYPLASPKLWTISTADLNWLGAKKENFELVLEVLGGARGLVAALSSEPDTFHNLDAYVTHLLQLEDPSLPNAPRLNLTQGAALGFAVASIEQSSGWVKDRQTHVAAHNAICMHNFGTEADTDPYASFAVRAGHYYGRTQPIS